MGFRRGTEHVKEASSRSAFDKTKFFRWETGETKILRMFYDMEDVYTVWWHDMVECVDGRNRSFVCRQEMNEPCELCDNADEQSRTRRRERSLGVAVLRLEHREDGAIVGYSDAVDEVDGKKVPMLGIIKMGPKNFWMKFEHFYQRYGTIIDRDYEITRIGSGTNTDYIFVPCDPVALPQGYETWRAYLDERYGPFVPDIEEMLKRMVSQDYYDRWLHGKAVEDGSVAAVVREETTVFDRLRQERERLAGQSGA